MQPSAEFRVAKHLLWRVLIVVVAIGGLTVSLATRTFRLTIPHVITVQSNAQQPMRQHLDRDAVPWIPPYPVLTTLQVPTFYPPVAPVAPPIPGTVFDESFYNRPPPSC
jgi:hypothetical protein